MAKIAFLCLAHNNFDYINEVAQYYCSDGDQLFLHVDAAVADTQIKLTNPDIKILPRNERFRTRWGTFDIVSASVALIKAALTTDCFDRFVLISGADIPLLTKAELKQKLSANVSYFSQWKVVDYPQRTQSKSTQCKNTAEFFKRHFYHMKWSNPGEAYASQRRFNIYCMRLINKLIALFPLSVQFSFNQYIKGSQWWAITSELAHYFVKQLAEPNIADQFTSMHAPDEKVFHTLAYHSPFNHRIDWDFDQSSLKQGLHYINWGVTGNNVGQQPVKPEDIAVAKSLGCCFARKVNREDFDDLLPYLHELVQAPPS